MDGSATRCACARPTCTPTSLDEALSERIRASILLAGPLLARFGSADVPLPGGDVIGRRRVDSHLLALAALGAEVTADRTYRFRAPGGLKGTEFHLDEASRDGHGERAHGRGAGRGHDDDPPRGLRAARAGPLPAAGRDGRRSSRASARTCCASHGRAPRSGGASHVVCPDHIEVGSFIGMAAVTGGDVTITGCEPNDLRATLLAFARLGIRVEIDGARRARPARPGARRRRRRARPDRRRSTTARGRAFPADMTSVAVAVATQAQRHRARSSRRCSRTAWCSRTSSSTWARGSSSATRTGAVITGPAKLYGAAALEPGHPRRHRAADRRRCAPRARA